MLIADCYMHLSSNNNSNTMFGMIEKRKEEVDGRITKWKMTE